MINVTFILNETAGNGKAEKVWNAWHPHFNFPFTLKKTEYSSHAKEISMLIAEQTTEEQLIIVVGGDGTVHEVISGIIGKEQVRLGVISGGSGNDFGRAFSVFKTPLQLNQYISQLAYKYFDIGEFKAGNTNFSFVNSAGFGYDASISVEVNKSPWKKTLNTFGLGKLVYVVFLIKELFTFQTFSTTLRMGKDKVKFDNVWFVTISNQPYYGGGMKISPGSIPDDQLLEITLVHDLPKWKLLLVFGTVFLGAHTKFKEVRQYQAGEFQLEFNQSIKGHVDGEYACMVDPFKNVHFSFIPHAWKNAIPQKKELM